MKGILITGNNAEVRKALALDACRVLAESGLKVAAARIAPDPACSPDAVRDFTDAGICAACLADGITAMAWPESGFLPDLLPLARADVLVAEAATGDETGWLPRILLDPDPDADAYPVLKTGEDAPDAAELARLATEKGFVLPGLDCGSCDRKDCAALAREIVAGKAGPEDCAAAGGGMRVTVNGSTLGLNLFLERMLAAGLKGMLGQLKGYAPGKIVIEMDA